MKRTELKRSSPLSRGKGKHRVPMAGFWWEVTKDGRAQCAVANLDCAGRITAHHYILEQRLPDEAKADPRVGLPLCWKHHLDVHSAHSLEIPRPPLLDDFLADHGLLESGRPDPKREAA